MEDARTPSRRITRSITVLSESKERDSPSVKELLKTSSHNEKSEKRPPVSVEEEEYSIKKKKMAKQSISKVIKPTAQLSYFVGKMIR
ncbi:Hypothetical predicted protein [Olea europaea subsp. europaea]|uniref:Uncharacterized protein n=1 Tax=Olea europaea subsp. europaea TaxID=158383 RepID=A0A8S0QB67_OLEEU|nr:Hypothetical predicted protein [Olea europaea subsp. europaea]